MTRLGNAHPIPAQARQLLRRLWLQRVSALGVASILLAGCATPRPSITQEGSQVWAGRLSMQIDSTPPRNFSAGFELSGDPTAGQLQLLSPLGQIVASARWDARGAQLQQGQQVNAYPDTDALTTATTGTALPLGPLFAWLQGQAVPLDGWEVDLSRHADGRLVARRTHPMPAVQLRMVFQ